MSCTHTFFHRFDWLVQGIGEEVGSHRVIEYKQCSMNQKHYVSNSACAVRWMMLVYAWWCYELEHERHRRLSYGDCRYGPTAVISWSSRCREATRWTVDWAVPSQCLNDAGAFETIDAKTKTRENKGHHPAMAATTLPALVGEMKEEGSKSVPDLIEWTTMAYNQKPDLLESQALHWSSHAKSTRKSFMTQSKCS